MNEYQLRIVADAKNIVTEIFLNKINPLFVFHNLDHTQQVVNAVEEIQEYYQLDDNDQFILSLSAWFHDTGFCTGQSEEHEKESIKLAREFLYHRCKDSKVIDQVSSCIQSTHMPQEPLTLVEKIICDADLYHLSTNMFNKKSDCLRKELQNYYNCGISKEEWRQRNIEFLMSHRYFTGYCQQKLEPIKQALINQLQINQGTMA